MRDKLQKCMNELINALSIFADLYQLSPVGTYEIVFDFGDITYNEMRTDQDGIALLLQEKSHSGIT